MLHEPVNGVRWGFRRYRVLLHELDRAEIQYAAVTAARYCATMHRRSTAHQRNSMSAVCAVLGVLVAAGCTTNADTVAVDSANASGYKFRDSFYFRSSDGAYACGILAPADRGDMHGAGCHGTTSPVPPRPSDCPEGPGWGRGLQVSATGGVSFLCTGGVIYANGFSDAPLLPVGEPLSALGFSCESIEDGVRCSQIATGHGFTIRPQSNEQF